MWTIIGLITKYETFPRKFHRAKKTNDTWVFKCGQQDMVRGGTTIKEYSVESIGLYPSEVCGSCWRVVVWVWANG